MKMGVIGCGDFLRWQAPGIKNSRSISAKLFFDPATERAQKYADMLGGQVARSADAILADAEIDVVCLFVPPWIRTDLWIAAAKAGKHILATKPLAASIDDCRRILALGDTLRSGVLYGRSGDGWSVALKRLLDSGEIGRLALYRQDWLHHYPQWNNWALDPARNGGPFMDAMIHNLNLCRYLMDRPITAATFHSAKLAHPDLTCADTEAMQLSFAGNGWASLFITWAADLAVHSTDGNNREHIDLFYLVTDKGWRITREWIDKGPTIVASRQGEKRFWPAADLGGTVFDRFAGAVQTGTALPQDIVSAQMAAQDILLLRTLEKEPAMRSMSL